MKEKQHLPEKSWVVNACECVGNDLACECTGTEKR
jgi:hypothetical protein